MIYQLGGLIALGAALWPGGAPLLAFAVALGNLWVGMGVWRSRRG